MGETRGSVEALRKSLQDMMEEFAGHWCERQVEFYGALYFGLKSWTSEGYVNL